MNKMADNDTVSIDFKLFIFYNLRNVQTDFQKKAI